MEKVKKEFLQLFTEGNYIINTTYSKKLKKENRIGIGSITHEDVDGGGTSVFMTHSGEDNHYEKVCFLFNDSEVNKVHTSKLTNATSYGNKLYLSKNKNLMSSGKGFSHIHKCYIEYKKIVSKDDDDIVLKTYIKKNNDKFSLQSVTRLTPS